MGRRSFFFSNSSWRSDVRAVVMKFGGSSVADAVAIGRVASIVAGERGRGRSPVVVVSALGGVTDRLLALAEAARRGEEFDDGVAAPRQRHVDEMMRLGAGDDAMLLPAVDRHFGELREALESIRQRRSSD